MRTHEERSGGAGGYPDDRKHSNAPAATPPGRPVASAGPKASQGAKAPGSLSYDFYDDEGYSEPTSTLGRKGDEYDDDFTDERKPFGWTGGADLGLLIVRLALGGLFVAHGAQKLFGALGGPGPEVFAQSLQKMGYQQSAILSLVTGGTELGSGALLILGLFTPLAAAGILGVMSNAVLNLLPAGFFSPQGFELPAILGAVALGVMFTGPGRVALDYGRAWFRRPITFGFISLIIAAGASASVLLLLHQPMF